MIRYCGKKAFWIITLAMILVLSASVALATPTLEILTTTWSENTIINISTKDANDDSLINMSNITIRLSSASTANSSTSVLYNISNNTATNFDLGYANFTFSNELILEDANDYSAVAVSTGTGDSDGVTSSATTITVDRTAPTTPTGVGPTGDVDSGTQSFTSTVQGENTTACTLTFIGTNPGSPTYTMTHSANECTLSLSMADSLYKYSITASDGTNESTTSDQTLNIGSTSTSSGGSGGASTTPLSTITTKEETQTAQQASQEPMSETQKVLIGAGVGVVVGVVIGNIALPIVGTVPGVILGAIIGGLIGWMF